jgi:nucleoside 2-deoxyribosyltransferase
MSKKAFVICPVRDNPEAGRSHTMSLELAGWDVHWPARDTEQVDDTGGFRICQDNRAAIEKADVIFFVWDGKSKGCLFDLGMAFALRKRVIPLELPTDDIEGKSFVKVVKAYDKFFHSSE